MTEVLKSLKVNTDRTQLYVEQEAFHFILENRNPDNRNKKK